MTIDEACVAYRPWAVKKVRVWMHANNATRADYSAAEDIVQEALLDVWRLKKGLDIVAPQALIKKVCRWRYGRWVESNLRMRRDANLTNSLDKFLEEDADFDRPCPTQNTAASALARIEIAEKLRLVGPVARRHLLRSSLTVMPYGTERSTADVCAARARRVIEKRTVAA